METASSTSSFSSSPSSSNRSRRSEVLLSFCAEDTGNNFTSHLQYALKKKGIHTFGNEDKSIEDSKCSIIIFSPNYASSTSRLDEIVKIIDCKETKGLIVIPVFYGVDPTHVRYQTGSFGQVLAQHEQDFRAQRWRDTLLTVANIAGMHLQNRNEAEFISDIVQVVSSKTSTESSSKISEGLMNSLAATHFPWLEGIRYCFSLKFFFSHYPSLL